MSKPDDITIKYELIGWGIEYEKQGYDVGDVGPDYVDFSASVSWQPTKNDYGINKRKNFSKAFATLPAAKKWIEEQTELSWKDL